MTGVWTNQNAFVAGFTVAQQEQNAREIWGYFFLKGWTLESVSGMLGNIEYESYINPAQWELGHTIEDPADPNYTGFGLVQWTPWYKFANWAGSDWRTNYRKQLDRIQWELDTDSGQWIPVSAYNYMTFQQFTQSTQTPEYLAQVFEYSYERGHWSTDRATFARKWYEFLGGAGPIYPHIPIWLLFKLKERYTQ